MAVVSVLATALVWGRNWFSLDDLVEHELAVRDFCRQFPLAAYALAFVLYAGVTGLSLPGAALLTLVYGWLFGVAGGTVLVSLASTTGATLAFLCSRYLFRDAVQERFGHRLEKFNRALESEGAFYLFTLRLIPQVPFFLINLVMGLTPIRVTTFWWVSQLGMLPATVVYVYAGSTVPGLAELAERGVGAAVDPKRLTQLSIAFVLLGVFPLLTRWAIKRWRRSAVSSTNAQGD